MTEVYLLLWLADVVGSVGVIGVISAIVLCCGTVVASIILGLLASEEHRRVENLPPAVMVMVRHCKWLILFVALAALAPDPKTVRIMAAAQAAKVAVATPIGEKALQAIDAVLDSIIGKAKK